MEKKPDQLEGGYGNFINSFLVILMQIASFLQFKWTLK